MNYADYNLQDLIYLFLDGEADEFQKEILFIALANDNELRNHFQEAVSFNRMIDNEIVTTSTPVELTQKLFIAAGIRPVSGSTGWFERTGLYKVGARIIKNTYVVLTTGLVTGILVTFFVINPFLTDEKDIRTSSNDLPAKSDNSGNMSRTISTDQLPNSDKKHNYISTANTLALNETQESSPGVSVNTSNQADNDFQYINPITESTTEFSVYRLHFSEEFYDVNNRDLSSDYTSQKSFNIEVKGMESIYQNPENVRNERGIITNPGISLYYSPDGENYFGIGYTYEDIGIFQKDSYDNYVMKNSISYYSISYRYKMKSIIPDIQLDPFYQANLGWSSSGPMAKASTGLACSPMADISMNIGLELGILAYGDRNAIKTAFKTGVFYGISYKL